MGDKHGATAIGDLLAAIKAVRPDLPDELVIAACATQWAHDNRLFLGRAAAQIVAVADKLQELGVG